ncbi:MAG: DUF1501 domain-containing protein [Chloroflexaceae bacterium]|nr:DUF1501 domain-containing protein [Chloroflexaceae bacterium]
MEITRRQFMVGCSTAIAALAGARISNMVFAEEQADIAAGNDNVLVVVFLRGGCDGLSLVAPYDDPNYLAARASNNSWESLAVNNAIQLNPNNGGFGATSNFGFHPGAAPLNELYQEGKLGIIHACGLDDDTRSHFDAMDYMERGTPGQKFTSSGWLARHLRVITSDDGSTLPSLSAGSAAPASLLSDTRAISMNDSRSYDLSTPHRYRGAADNTNPRLNDAMLKALETMYRSGSAVSATGLRTIETIRSLRGTSSYAPAGGVTYPSDNFGFSNSLQIIAQSVKRNLGLRVATVDLGGWDHHENQGVNESQWGAFYTLTNLLSRGLHALYDDLAADNLQNKVTVVVMSEFGRRLGKNDSRGTDHGHGNVMLVLGGDVRGGRMLGKWPGLGPGQLDRNEDLKITTDYRVVMGEILANKFGNARLGAVFPGITSELYASQRTGVMTASDNTRIDFTPVNPAGPNSIYLPLVRR